MNVKHTNLFPRAQDIVAFGVCYGVVERVPSGSVWKQPPDFEYRAFMDLPNAVDARWKAKKGPFFRGKTRDEAVSLAFDDFKAGGDLSPEEYDRIAEAIFEDENILAAI